MNWKQIAISALGVALLALSFVPGMESAKDVLQKTGLALVTLGIPIFVATSKGNGPGVAGLAVMLGIGAYGSACTGAGKITCAVIHAADVACPYVIVELPDGGREALPKGPIVRAAELTRKARLDAEQGGAR